jgi:F-type H+-transporting ATPase subunit c
MMTQLLSTLQAAAPEAAEAANKLASAGAANGSLTLGLAGAGAGIGIGLIGFSAAQAVGRNPGAFGNILTISIIAMALAEAIAIYAFVIALGGR